MQAVESTVSSVSLDCYELLLHDSPLPPSNFADHVASSPRFVFSEVGSIICTFSTNQLHCQFPNGKVFSWTVSESSFLISGLKNWPADAPLSWTIVDVAFLPSSPQILLLLAPLENEKPLRSIICLIDLKDGTSISFLRFISIRGKATCVHVVSTDRKSLPAFQGAAVVALERGQVTLLDLCLDWNVPDRTYLETSAFISLDQYCDSISARELVSPLTAKMEHSLVNLNASRISLNNFYYQTPRDETAEKFPSVSVSVTLLSYVPQIKALVVGFSFGGWQLWDLGKLKILYTFRDLPPAPVPVVGCAFTEPSDDPRYYCYLWIGWQSVKNPSKSEHKSASSSVNPKVGLFQLGFRGRTEHIQPGTEDTLYEYENFYGATRRLSTVLSPITASIGHETSHWRSQGTFLTSIQSLGTNYAANFGLRSNRLTALVWRAAPRIVRIGLFDLDRWYHAQMPASIRSDNSFFAVYDAFLDQPQAHPLTAHILPHTIYAYWANVYRRELSAFKICGEVAAVKTPLRGYQDLRKPLPECQLRPSTHGFKALVPFHRGKTQISASVEIESDYSVAFVTQKFLSRQELALREIANAISEPSNSTFNPTEWVAEAAACGLLQEFEDTDIDIFRVLKEAEGSDWIMRLAFGIEIPPLILLKQIAVMDSEEEDIEGTETVEPMSPQKNLKRQMPSFHGSGGRVAKKPRRDDDEVQLARGPKYLPPLWVIIVNCLFEHGMYAEIKKLDGLIYSLGKQDFNPRLFIRRWLWLRWLGKKHLLEDLLSPVFDANGESKTKRSFEDVIKDLCLCFKSLGLFNPAQLEYSGISQAVDYSFGRLRVIADIAEVVMSRRFSYDDDDIGVTDSASVSAEAKLKLIQALAEYTRPVSLLIRLGLLPQKTSNRADSANTPTISALSPYNHEEIDGLIRQLQAFHKVPASLPPFITGCLLDHLRSTLTASDQIESASVDAVTSSYPPRHLQSICALWQLLDTSVSSHLPVHLALLTFILFDAVTVNALHEEEKDDLPEQNQRVHHVGRLRLVEVDKNQMEAKSSTPPRLGPVARAVKLQQYVVNQIVLEFPDFKKFVSTVRTLWLIDRFRFADVLCSRLSPLATGQVTELGYLPELFPDQARLVAKHCILHGQTELAARFAPHSASDQTAGCVVSGLYQTRQVYSKKPNRQEASKVLIEAANAFERRGQFLDFISPGLSHWEAAVLFNDLRCRGRNRLLLASLIARAQYKEAQNVLAEIDSSGGRKLSMDPIVRSLIFTMSSCLPQLKFLSPFSLLIPELREASLPARLSADSVASSASGLDDSKRCRTLYVEREDGNTESYLAKQFATPKCDRLPSVQPSTEDRRRAAEFWNEFDLTQRVLRGEKPFDTPRSPVKPNITDSARRLSRKLKRLLYASSVVSPFPQSHKKKSDIFTSIGESTTITFVSGAISSRSRSESEEQSRQSNLSTTASTTSSSSAHPTTSILKVRSTPTLPPKEALEETTTSELLAAPILTPVKKQRRRKRAKTFTITVEEKQDDGNNDVDLEAKASAPSENSVVKDSSSMEATIDDDAEITLNASTVHLTHKVSLVEDDVTGAEAIAEYPLSSSGRYVFSPPIRTIGPTNLHYYDVDEMAEAMWAARQFTFASPATFLAKQFIAPVSGAAITQIDSTVMEDEGFNFNANADIEGFTFDNETEDDSEAFNEEVNMEVALTAGNDDELSTLPETEEKEEESVEIQTPRRSRRKIKKPQRFHY
ncbi:hypothetical protein Aperf_G00000050824 [Anoplocephala perfoliata]